MSEPGSSPASTQSRERPGSTGPSFASGQASPASKDSPSSSAIAPCQQSDSNFSLILALLRATQWPANMLRRKSVSSADPLQSGYFNFGPKASSPHELTQATLTMQDFVCKLNASLRALMPQATWNAVCVGWNTLSGMCRDSGNQPGSMNHTFCVGDFKGGALWLKHAWQCCSFPPGRPGGQRRHRGHFLPPHELPLSPLAPNYAVHGRAVGDHCLHPCRWPT